METKNDSGIKELTITKNTLKKIRDYSELVCEKGDIECYGFLLNPKSKKDSIVYNAILACGQRVSSCSATAGPIGLLESKAEIENLGYDAIGCWHSHHNMGAWHSGIDNSNLEKLVSTIACNRELTTKKELPNGYFTDIEKHALLIRENEVEIEIKASKPISFSSQQDKYNAKLYYGYTRDKRLFLNFNNMATFLDLDEHKISFRNTQKEKLTSLGFAYSLVVSKNKNYAEIALKDTCNICGHSGIIREPVEIKIIEPQEDIQFTEKELIDEIKRKVRTARFLHSLFK